MKRGESTETDEDNFKNSEMFDDVLIQTIQF